MNTHLHNSDEIFSSAQDGWEQMKFLLDKKLPVTNYKTGRRLYLRIFTIAFLLAIFLFSTLILQDGSHQNFSSNFIIKPVANQLEITKVRYKKLQPINHNNTEKINTLPTFIALLNSTKKEKKVVSPENIVQSNTTSVSVTKITLQPKIKDHIQQPIEILNAINKSVKTVTSLAAKDFATSDSTNLTTLTRLRNDNRKWNLFGGIGINGMIGEHQNLQPYPVAVVRYNITNRFFMSLGLSARSPVSTNSNGIIKTVYLNDTANNFQLYNKVINYSHFYYVDIPLLAAINIGKRFSVQAGLQASVLLNSKSKSSIEKYDFQMRLANEPPNNLVSVMAAVRENNYKIDVRKMDYRFTTGLTYSINKTTFNVMYQHSLHPVLEGDNVSSDKNKLLTFSILYKIK